MAGCQLLRSLISFGCLARAQKRCVSNISIRAGKAARPAALASSLLETCRSTVEASAFLRTLPAPTRAPSRLPTNAWRAMERTVMLDHGAREFGNPLKTRPMGSTASYRLRRVRSVVLPLLAARTEHIGSSQLCDGRFAKVRKHKGRQPFLFFLEGLLPQRLLLLLQPSGAID